MNIIGNIECPNCDLETRFFIEDEATMEVALLGDKAEKDMHGVSECDYCQQEIAIHVIQVEGVISAFLSEEQNKAYEEGTLSITKAEKDAGILLEKAKELKQFQHTFTMDYTKQPLRKSRNIRVMDKNWKITAIHKKENTEKDPVVRIQSQTFDEYWYEVESEGEKRWITVQEDTENNAVLTHDMPVLKNNEAVYDITDKPEKTTMVLEREIGDNFQMKVYQMISGVRVTLTSLQEGNHELEFDCLADTFEEALEQIEELFAVNE